MLTRLFNSYDNASAQTLRRVDAGLIIAGLALVSFVAGLWSVTG